MSSPYFSSSVPIRFHHGDPAGISFFANVYQIAHDTFEDFVVHLGFEWKDWFKNETWAVPIRHSECDYLMPLRPSKTYKVRVVVERIGKSSFTLGYIFERAGKTYCHVQLVHTFLDIKSRSKMTMPSEIYERLETYQSQCLSAK